MFFKIMDMGDGASIKERGFFFWGGAACLDNSSVLPGRFKWGGRGGVWGIPGISGGMGIEGVALAALHFRIIQCTSTEEESCG